MIPCRDSGAQAIPKSARPPSLSPDDRCGSLRRQLLENLLSQLLRFAEKLLILHKLPVEFQRLVGRGMLAQNHVAHVHRVRQGRIFDQLFQRRIGIVVIHGKGLTPYTNSVVHRSCRWTTPSSWLLPSTTISDVIFFSSMSASAVAANSVRPIVFGFRVMASPAVRSMTSFPRFSSRRRKSPSLITPTSFPPSTTAVTPSCLLDIS